MLTPLGTHLQPGGKPIPDKDDNDVLMTGVWSPAAGIVSPRLELLSPPDGLSVCRPASAPLCGVGEHVRPYLA